MNQEDVEGRKREAVRDMGMLGHYVSELGNVISGLRYEPANSEIQTKVY